jgi:hypothetical protein
MSIYVLRLRDGNSIVTNASDEDHARKNVQPLAASEIVTVRELEAFVAQFVLNDNGELTATLLDKKTIADLHQHEYPMLGTANMQSYADFGASEGDSKTEAVLFSSTARRHTKDWEERDQQIVRYAVEQERLRFAN